MKTLFSQNTHSFFGRRKRDAVTMPGGGWLFAAALVLSCVVLLVTAFFIGRTEQGMTRLLAEKGAAIIRAIEGGLRTGMRSHVGLQLQTMLEETVGAGIFFVTVTMPDGTILAHSKPDRVGEILEIEGAEADEAALSSLWGAASGDGARWSITTMEGQRVFLVFSEFMGSKSRVPSDAKVLIFLGLDISPFEATQKRDKIYLLALAAGCSLLGSACLLVIYYAQRARLSRRRQKQAEGQVRLLEEEIRRKEKMAAIGNLAAGVAHEIRNPLSSIKGYATYFSQRFPSNSDESKAALVVVHEVDRLNRVITDLIGLSRPTDIHVVSVELITVVEHALRLLRQDAETHCVFLNLDAAKDLPKVLVDGDRLGQALLNICLNAIDAMPEGGDIWVRLRKVESEWVRIEIQDTGCGILPENMQRIFDPYFTTKGHGTGLGLATVQKIIEAHGGEITVTSQHKSQGRKSGTIFHILLPIRGGSL